MIDGVDVDVDVGGGSVGSGVALGSGVVVGVSLAVGVFVACTSAVGEAVG